MANKKKIGVVLSCGGMRGTAHIAVMEYLEELGIVPDVVVGASIGSIVGALYCLGRTDDFKNDFLKLTNREFIRNFSPALSKSGLLNADKILQYFMKYIPKNALLEDLKIPLAIVATNYETGKPVIFTKGNIISAIRASISIPGVFTPVSYNGNLLVDGGVSDPLPMGVAKQLGANIIIAVNLQPSVARKAELEEDIVPIASASGVSSLISRHVTILKNSRNLKTTGKWLERWLERKSTKKRSMPNMFDIMSHSIQTMLSLNTDLSIQKYNPDVLIEPNLLNLTGFSLASSKQGFAEGKKACEKEKAKLQKIAKENIA